MAKATFCPFLLIASEGMSIDEISEKFLDKSILYIDKCFEHEIDIEISRNIWEKTLDLFPWNTRGDQVLMQYVSLWRKLIFIRLQKKAKFIDVCKNEESTNECNQTCNMNMLGDMKYFWYDWLVYWQTGQVIKGKYLNGIFGDEIVCGPKQKHNCFKHIFIQELPEMLILLQPMYLKYPKTLPHKGDFPFVPPTHWGQNNISLKGKNGGYVDKENNEWIWGTHHGDHWDVQLAKGHNYMRVSPDGKKL